MIRIVLTAIALAAAPFDSYGDEEVVRLTVQPMAAPKPVLTYQLLPELRELKPGNAAQNYLKCFMEQRTFFFSKQAVSERTRYQTMPLADLPVETLRYYGGSALRQADWAARLDALDWQTLERVQSGGMETLADELGPFQDLAAALQVRFRAQVAGRHFDEAIGSAKTMFALARHLGEHPTEIANLVGLWVAHRCVGTLEEMVQQPGCPNLFWALTDLPSPLVDLRKGVQGDRTVGATNFQAIHDDKPMTESETEAFVSHLSGLLGYAREQSGRPPRSLRSRLQALVKDPKRVLAARQRLIESGRSAELVKTFLATQVILLDEKRAYEIQRDERMKLLALPLWQIDTSSKGEGGQAEAVGLFADLLPHIVKLRWSQVRLEQQVAVLRFVEALRLHAAGHGGNMPATAREISAPLPVDPVTGKPFVYTLNGSTARIRNESSSEKGQGLEFGVIYEVTLRK